MNRYHETYLLVDDDPLDLMILEDQLQQTDSSKQIIKTNCATEALEVIRSGQTIDLLLMDICMPGIDGALFLRQLAESHFSARIILVSSLNAMLMHSIGELGRTHGLNLIGFIQKPVPADALKVLLAQSHISSQLPAVLPPQINHQSPKHADLSETRLRQAITAGEIRPWYQPKIDYASHNMSGVEALARWCLPDGTMISPGVFIPAIESHALADELFDSILQQALADMWQWRSAGRFFKASVNLSMDCAQDLGLPERIEQIAKPSNVPLDQLIIEVTESRLMFDKSKALETLSRLSLKGIGLSIDDFGTGYSSLSQLAVLPFSELKIDSSFVQCAPVDRKAMAILKGTIGFGRSLGMDVVAEGVETFEQLELLDRLGATQIQGYLIARPMPAAKLESWHPEVEFK